MHAKGTRCGASSSNDYSTGAEQQADCSLLPHLVNTVSLAALQLLQETPTTHFPPTHFCARLTGEAMKGKSLLLEALMPPLWQAAKEPTVEALQGT